MIIGCEVELKVVGRRWCLRLGLAAFSFVVAKTSRLAVWVKMKAVAGARGRGR